MLFNDLDNISSKGGGKHEQKCADLDLATGNSTDNGNLDCIDTVLEVGKKSLIITEEKFSSDI